MGKNKEKISYGGHLLDNPTQVRSLVRLFKKVTLI